MEHHLYPSAQVFRGRRAKELLFSATRMWRAGSRLPSEPAFICCSSLALSWVPSTHYTKQLCMLLLREGIPKGLWGERQWAPQGSGWLQCPRGWSAHGWAANPGWPHASQGRMNLKPGFVPDFLSVLGWQFYISLSFPHSIVEMVYQVPPAFLLKIIVMECYTSKSVCKDRDFSSVGVSANWIFLPPHSFSVVPKHMGTSPSLFPEQTAEVLL